MDMLDDRFVALFPLNPTTFVPGKPLAAFLVENMEGFVAKFGELGTPSSTTLDCLVLQNLADNVNLLPVIDLVPDALKDFSKHRTVSVASVHQTRQILQTDVSSLQLLMIEHPQSTVSECLVAFEGKVDFFDSKPLRVDAELGFRALSTPAEQDAIFLYHVCPFNNHSRGDRSQFRPEGFSNRASYHGEMNFSRSEDVESDARIPSMA